MRSNRLLTMTAAAALSAAIAVPQIAAAQAPAPAAAPATAQPAPTAAAAPAAPATEAPAAEAPATAAAPAAPSTTTAAPTVVAKGDLVETLKASGQFTTLLKATDATNLTGVLKNNQNLTIFAPTDAAFAALPQAQLTALMADKPALQKLLTHHVINARVDSSKIKGAKGGVTSVANDKIELDGSTDTLKADNATIIQADVVTTNGVLHVVDHVLIAGTAPATPPAAVQ